MPVIRYTISTGRIIDCRSFRSAAEPITRILFFEAEGDAPMYLLNKLLACGISELNCLTWQIPRRTIPKQRRPDFDEKRIVFLRRGNDEKAGLV